SIELVAAAVEPALDARAALSAAHIIGGRAHEAAGRARAARERHAATVALVERLRIAGELVAAAVEAARDTIGGWRELDRDRRTLAGRDRRARGARSEH